MEKIENTPTPFCKLADYFNHRKENRLHPQAHNQFFKIIDKSTVINNKKMEEEDIKYRVSVVRPPGKIISFTLGERGLDEYIINEERKQIDENQIVDWFMKINKTEKFEEPTSKTPI